MESKYTIQNRPAIDKNKLVIGCGYKKRVGKDTTYEQVKSILEEHGYKVLRIAFADPLKEEFYQLILKPNGLDKSILDDDYLKKILRPGMEWYGTDFKRNPELGGDPDHWINLALSKIEDSLAHEKVCVVITDVRFPNELINLTERFNAITINVLREQKMENTTSKHASEVSLDDYVDDFSVLLDNNGTIPELKENVRKILQDFEVI